MAEKEKHTILHVFLDEKFFDETAYFFDSLKNFESRYVLYVKNAKDYKYKYIKSGKAELIDDKEKYFSLFNDKDIDIIYFHSLPPSFHNRFKYIGKDKIVIWWCWGYDIYSSQRGLKPLVSINQYKPRTQQFIEENASKRSLKSSITEFRNMIYRPYGNMLRNKALKRVDYFSPVISIEYGLMQKNTVFKAKPFMLNLGPGKRTEVVELKHYDAPGNVLIGNSFTYTNNHLDIAPIIKGIDIGDRKYVIPISYGDDYGKDRERFKKLMDLEPSTVLWLEQFYAKDKYYEIVDSCTHAVFGHMRLQAFANIVRCLMRGIKIFLYKDSLFYQYLSKEGFKVYSIEDDLNKEELNKILPEEYARINHNLMNEKYLTRERTAEQEFDNLFS